MAKRIRVGDLFAVDLSDRERTFGQVAAPGGRNHYFFTFFGPTYSIAAVPAVEDVLSAEIVLIVHSMDFKLKNGEWPILGNHSVDPDDIPLPAYKVSTDAEGGYEVEDYTGLRRRPASQYEVGLLAFRTTLSPAAVVRVLRAYHGLEPWDQRDERLRVPPPEGQSRVIFGPQRSVGEDPPAGNAPLRPHDRSSLQDPDAAVLRELESAGADLRETREIHHFLYFRSKHSARAAERRLKDRRFAVDVRRQPDRQWLVRATTTTLVSSEYAKDMRAQMESVATALGGEYDGWEAAV